MFGDLNRQYVTAGLSGGGDLGFGPTCTDSIEPSSCPPSICFTAASASVGFENSNAAFPRLRPARYRQRFASSFPIHILIHIFIGKLE
jgi:hypothetical protein